MNLWLLTIVFCVPIAVGCTAALFTLIRDRRRMAVAFRQGRVESVVRLPQPVEPMPTFEVA